MRSAGDDGHTPRRPGRPAGGPAPRRVAAPAAGRRRGAGWAGAAGVGKFEWWWRAVRAARWLRLFGARLGVGIVAGAALALAPAHLAGFDGNGNELCDFWERDFNHGELFDPANPDHGPDADPDGDGWTNLN